MKKCIFNYQTLLLALFIFFFSGKFNIYTIVILGLFFHFPFVKSGKSTG